MGFLQLHIISEVKHTGKYTNSDVEFSFMGIS